MTAIESTLLESPSVPLSSQEMSLGELIGTVLVEHGIDDLFCIPGDFTMQLSRELLGTPGLTLRTMSHEYGTTLAAMGYALARGVPAAVCFTYGVGVLNATNGIAQAFVERVPLLVFSGAPGKKEREADIFLHHTIVDHDSQFRILSEITCHQVRITDAHLALGQLREAIRIASEASRPVYLEIPRDLYQARVRYLPPLAKNVLGARRYSEAAWTAATHAIDLLQSARQPVCVPGLEIKRLGLADAVGSLIEHLGLPWVASPMSREVLSPLNPYYRGVYAGPASPVRATRDLLESCDVLLLLGEPNSDVNMGIASQIARGRLIQAWDGEIQVGRHHFTASISDFVLALTELVRNTIPRVASEVKTSDLWHAPEVAGEEPDPGPLSPFAVIAELNRYFSSHPDTLLVSDCGDSFFMSLGMFPKDVLTSSLYMSMGIGVPGALGSALGNGQRPVVLVGDGAFHMTGQELMHARRFGVSPVVIVLNNACWTSLSIAEKDRPLTGLQTMDFTRLGEFYEIPSFTATTAAELREHLGFASTATEPVLIDARIDSSKRSYLCERFFDAIAQQQHLPKS